MIAWVVWALRVVFRRPAPWPCRRWPRPGETVDHQACREWNLECACPKCRSQERGA